MTLPFSPVQGAFSVFQASIWCFGRADHTADRLGTETLGGAATGTRRQLHQIVYVTPEVYPWVKVGGLGQVSSELPVELASRGHRVMVVTPQYRESDDTYNTGYRIPVVLPTPPAVHGAQQLAEHQAPHHPHEVPPAHTQQGALRTHSDPHSASPETGGVEEAAQQLHGGVPKPLASWQPPNMQTGPGAGEATTNARRGSSPFEVGGARVGHVGGSCDAAEQGRTVQSGKGLIRGAPAAHGGADAAVGVGSGVGGRSAGAGAAHSSTDGTGVSTSRNCNGALGRSVVGKARAGVDGAVPINSRIDRRRPSGGAAAHTGPAYGSSSYHEASPQRGVPRAGPNHVGRQVVDQHVAGGWAGGLGWVPPAPPPRPLAPSRKHVSAPNVHPDGGDARDDTCAVLHVHRSRGVDFVFVAHPYVREQVRRSCEVARRAGLDRDVAEEVVWSAYAADSLLGGEPVADAAGVFSLLAQAALAAPAILWGHVGTGGDKQHPRAGEQQREETGKPHLQRCGVREPPFRDGQPREAAASPRGGTVGDKKPPRGDGSAKQQGGNAGRKHSLVTGAAGGGEEQQKGTPDGSGPTPSGGGGAPGHGLDTPSPVGGRQVGRVVDRTETPGSADESWPAGALGPQFGRGVHLSDTFGGARDSGGAAVPGTSRKRVRTGGQHATQMVELGGGLFYVANDWASGLLPLWLRHYVAASEGLELLNEAEAARVKGEGSRGAQGEASGTDSSGGTGSMRSAGSKGSTGSTGSESSMGIAGSKIKGNPGAQQGPEPPRGTGSIQVGQCLPRESRPSSPADTRRRGKDGGAAAGQKPGGDVGKLKEGDSFLGGGGPLQAALATGPDGMRRVASRNDCDSDCGGDPGMGLGRGGGAASGSGAGGEVEGGNPAGEAGQSLAGGHQRRNEASAASSLGQRALNAEGSGDCPTGLCSGAWGPQGGTSFARDASVWCCARCGEYPSGIVGPRGDAWSTGDRVGGGDSDVILGADGGRGVSVQGVVGVSQPRSAWSGAQQTELSQQLKPWGDQCMEELQLQILYDEYPYQQPEIGGKLPERSIRDAAPGGLYATALCEPRAATPAGARVDAPGDQGMTSSSAARVDASGEKGAASIADAHADAAGEQVAADSIAAHDESRSAASEEFQQVATQPGSSVNNNSINDERLGDVSGQDCDVSVPSPATAPAGPHNASTGGSTPPLPIPHPATPPAVRSALEDSAARVTTEPQESTSNCVVPSIGDCTVSHIKPANVSSHGPILGNPYRFRPFALLPGPVLIPPSRQLPAPVEALLEPSSRRHLTAFAHPRDTLWTAVPPPEARRFWRGVGAWVRANRTHVVSVVHSFTHQGVAPARELPRMQLPPELWPAYLEAPEGKDGSAVVEPGAADLSGGQNSHSAQATDSLQGSTPQAKGSLAPSPPANIERGIPSVPSKGNARGSTCDRQLKDPPQDAPQAVHGRMNWLQGSLQLSDAVVVVSHAYATAIRQHVANMLEPPPRHHKSTPLKPTDPRGSQETPAGDTYHVIPGTQVSAGSSEPVQKLPRPRVYRGIHNGLDVRTWDPGNDGHLLPHLRFAPATVARGKARAKAHVQRALGLNGDSGAVLLVYVGRLAREKGSDTLLLMAPGLLGGPLEQDLPSPQQTLRGQREQARTYAPATSSRGRLPLPAPRAKRPNAATARGPRVQLAMLGVGDPWQEAAVRNLHVTFPGRAAGRAKFDPGFARLMLAAGDYVLVPSREEPCGLVAMQALRYGCVPIVSQTGGLVDTVGRLGQRRQGVRDHMSDRVSDHRSDRVRDHVPDSVSDQVPEHVQERMAVLQGEWRGKVAGEHRPGGGERRRAGEPWREGGIGAVVSPDRGVRELNGSNEGPVGCYEEAGSPSTQAIGLGGAVDKVDGVEDASARKWGAEAGGNGDAEVDGYGDTTDLRPNAVGDGGEESQHDKCEARPELHSLAAQGHLRIEDEQHMGDGDLRGEPVEHVGRHVGLHPSGEEDRRALGGQGATRPPLGNAQPDSEEQAALANVGAPLGTAQQGAGSSREAQSYAEDMQQVHCASDRSAGGEITQLFNEELRGRSMDRLPHNSRDVGSDRGKAPPGRGNKGMQRSDGHWWKGQLVGDGWQEGAVGILVGMGVGGGVQLGAWKRAVRACARQWCTGWYRRLQHEGMTADLSWHGAVTEWEEVFDVLLEETTSGDSGLARDI